MKTLKQWIQKTFDKTLLQWAGIVLLVGAYILFGLKHPYYGWLGCLFPVGVIELVLIWCFQTTTTSFARNLFVKKIDTAIMLGIIPLTWWLFGPLAAGMLFIGLLLNHFGEKQPRGD